MIKNPLRRSITYRDGFPVLPGYFPWVGHVPAFYVDLPNLLREAEAMLGPLFWFEPNFGQWVLMFTAPEALDLLRNKVMTSAHYRKTSPVLLDDSILAVDGPAHQRARSTMQGTFSPRGLASSGAPLIIAELIAARTRRWADQRDILVLRETQELALDIIFRAMGIDLTELPLWRTQYREFLLAMLAVPIMLPGFPRYRALKAAEFLNSGFRGIMSRARGSSSDAAPPEGLLAALSRATDDEGKPLPERELLANFRLLGLAGHETTASTLAWMVIELARAPKLWDALCAEALREQHVPTAPQDLRRFPFAEAIFREALRLHPPIELVTRQTTDWVTLKTHRVPPGTIMGIGLGHISRDPTLYPDPLRFDPSRWLGKKEPPGPIETCQFAAGPHFCLGYHLAWMESVQFATSLALTMAPAGLRPRLAAGPEPTTRYFPLAHPTPKVRITFV